MRAPIIMVCLLILLTACGVKTEQPPQIESPPTITDILTPPQKECSITLDKYLLGVNSQNILTIKANPSMNCEIVEQRGNSNPVLIDIKRTNSRGIYDFLFTHRQTGNFRYWAVCDTCTSDIREVTVTQVGAAPPQSQTCQDLANQAGVNANMQPNVVDNNRCSTIATNHCGANGIAFGQFYPTIEQGCCVWTCNQAPPSAPQPQCHTNIDCIRFGRNFRCVNNQCVFVQPPPLDTDGDGTPDTTDTDDDNDGFSDQEEIQHGTDPLNPADFPQGCQVEIGLESGSNNYKAYYSGSFPSAWRVDLNAGGTIEKTIIQNTRYGGTLTFNHGSGRPWKECIDSILTFGLPSGQWNDIKISGYDNTQTAIRVQWWWPSPP